MARHAVGATASGAGLDLLRVGVSGHRALAFGAVLPALVALAVSVVACLALRHHHAPAAKVEPAERAVGRLRDHARGQIGWLLCC
ncbi:MAG TPA: hypothetical protein VIY28_08320 [Pseudonocardiaceae bacterium]